jgi:7,8-dihydropterin-6-yl-methyl-4-(beta-D-ribofuranosyl)aminobenzene 5'-phosphate synthase
MSEVRLIDIYDNVSLRQGVTPGWGFSALLSSPGFELLFDTGADVKILKDNMELLEVSPENLDGIFLSHPHCDHVGGLSSVLRESTDLKVYITSSFPRGIKDKIRNYGAELAELHEPERIFPGLSSTGEMKGNYRGNHLPEQSLILDTEEGPVVVSGCAHPGISKIVRKAKEISGEAPHLVAGGFHLGSSSEKKIRRVIKDFESCSVEKIAPTHCTGKKATRMMKDAYGDDCLEFGAGRILEV